MDNRADIPKREAYIKHLISQLPKPEGRWSFSDRDNYEMQMSLAMRLDLLGEDGKLRSVEDLRETARNLKLGPMHPLPPEAEQFAVELAPVDVEGVKKQIDEMRQGQDAAVYKALFKRGDYSFVKPDGISFYNHMVVRLYYDYYELFDEGRPQPVSMSKDELMEKALACPHEGELGVYYEMAREGKSFMDAEGNYIPLGQLDIGFAEITKMAEAYQIHRVTDRVKNGKDLYDILVDREGAKDIDVEDVMKELSQPILQKFLNEVLARFPEERKMFHVMKEMVELAGKEVTYGKVKIEDHRSKREQVETEDDLDYGFGNDDLNNGFADDDDFGLGGLGSFGSFGSYGFRDRFRKTDNEIQLDQGMRFISNIVGKVNDQETGEHIELPISQGVRYALKNLKEPFRLERPMDPRYAPQQRLTAEEQVARPVSAAKQAEIDDVRDSFFGPGWRDRFTKSQGGNLPDPEDGEKKGGNSR